MIRFLKIPLVLGLLLAQGGHASLGQRYRAEVRAELAKPKPAPKAFTEEAIRDLPPPVQKHLRACGYMGKPVMFNARLTWKDFQLRRKPRARWMEMRAVQFNSVAQPARLVHMKAKWGGFLPFEGRDKFQNGHGNLLVETLSIVRLVNDTSAKITQSELVTLLAEALMVPAYALQPYMSWEPIDSAAARGFMNYGGIRVSGVFHFNAAGEFVRFDTLDRWLSPKDSSTTPWSAMAEGYRWQKGVRVASRYRAVWHARGGDLEYFRGRLQKVDYDVGSP